MKFLKIVGRFVYRVSGLQKLVESVRTYLFHYKLRIRMTPLSYKVFLFMLGLFIGYLGSLTQPASMTFTNETKQAEAEELPVIAEPVGPNIDEIVSKVYQLESSSGQNDGCKARGMVNGYGWHQSKFDWKCYKTHDEVKGYVTDWFKDKLENMTVEESLCYYNTGKVQSTCDYLEKYNEL